MSEEAREVFELVQNMMAGLDAQFQFWLSITFAVVVASHLARDELSRLLRIALAGLYLGCVALIAFKTLMYFEQGVHLSEILFELGEMPDSRWVPTIRWTRIAVMVAGTAAAATFVLIPSLTRRKAPRMKSDGS